MRVADFCLRRLLLLMDRKFPKSLNAKCVSRSLTSSGHDIRAIRVSLVFLLLGAGCAPTTGRIGLRPPANSVQTAAQANSTHTAAPTSAARVPASSHCPDRLNRTRAGGTVGSVVGLVAASALGSPLLGILYQVGGYAAGFASADPCAKQNAPGTGVTTQTANADAPIPLAKIAEDDIK